MSGGGRFSARERMQQVWTVKGSEWAAIDATLHATAVRVIPSATTASRAGSAGGPGLTAAMSRGGKAGVADRAERTARGSARRAPQRSRHRCLPASCLRVRADKGIFSRICLIKIVEDGTPAAGRSCRRRRRLRSWVDASSSTLICSFPDLTAPGTRHCRRVDVYGGKLCVVAH